MVMTTEMTINEGKLNLIQTIITGSKKKRDT